MEINKLYHGDNLIVMEEFPNESVDLIYLDSPFFSQYDYNEFDDKFADIKTYLQFLRHRIEKCCNVLKPTGNIYVHLDWHAVHYVKVMMDGIFGDENFRNEIVWCYAGGGIPKKDFPRKHDTILRYTKNEMVYKKDGVFNTEYRKYGEWIKNHIPRNSLLSGGKKLKTKRGTPINDWWTDLKSLTSYKKEWVGYPTQKPEALLERIIKVNSNPGDLVLDPFCGCGTTLAVAKKLGRNYIGIDINDEAIRLSQERLNSIIKPEKLETWI